MGPSRPARSGGLRSRAAAALLVAGALGCGNSPTQAPAEVVLEPTAPEVAAEDPIRFTLTNGSGATLTLRSCMDGRLQRLGEERWEHVVRPYSICVGGPVPVAPGETSRPFAIPHVPLSPGTYRGVQILWKGGSRVITMSQPFTVR